MKKVVLFCSDSPYSIFVIRCLGETGYRPECYCFGDRYAFLFSSRYIGKHRSFVTDTEALNFLLNEYPVYDDKPVLLTFPDIPAYLVDLHKDELERKFILMSAGENGQIVHWMSKINIGALAKKHGLTIPWTVEMGKDEPVPDNLEYPVFTKSVKTVDGGKQDESICWNRMELEERQQTISSDRFLVMKYIEKEKEYSYFGLSLNGRVYIDYRDECERFLPHSYGHKFCLCEKDALYENIVSMMKETGYNGLFDVEFILGKDGVLYFTEVNFRIDGAIYELSPGVNLPAEWCRLVEMTDNNLPQTLSLRKKCFWGMVETQDFKENVLTGKVGFFRWLKDFWGADTHLVFNLKDPIPAFVWIALRFKSCLKTLCYERIRL